MIVSKPIGTLADAAFQNKTVDYLDFEWYIVHKAIERRKTRGGMDIGIRMDDATKMRGFHQDDVLYADDDSIVCVNILPCDCIAVRVQTYAQAVKLCYEIGNRHAPLFYGEDDHEFLTPYEAPMMVLIEKLGLHPVARQGRLIPSQRISSAQGHGHAHSHSHTHEHSRSHTHDHPHPHSH